MSCTTVHLARIKCLFSDRSRTEHQRKEVTVLVDIMNDPAEQGRYKTWNGTGSICCTIQTWMPDMWLEIALIRTVGLCVRTLISRSVKATKTSTNRELRQAYKTAEAGHSQLWAQPWVMLVYELLNRTGNGFHILLTSEGANEENWSFLPTYSVLIGIFWIDWWLWNLDEYAN